MSGVIVSIHGIGTQSDHYADGLHAHLLAALGMRLAPTPLYLPGYWPPRDAALPLLGTWSGPDHHHLVPPAAWPAAPWAHVPIVYSDIEAGNDRGHASLEQALLTFLARGALDHFLTTVQNDIGLYVARNDHRERVRSFVHEVLLRLCARDDIGQVVINAHSNGTVIATDVLRQLSPASLARITCLVTSGCPLRKYADLLAWGTDFFTPPGRWLNVLDPRDPVADPLAGLLFAVDSETGARAALPIADARVDNVANSPPGGLPAHNYWDNTREWVPLFVGALGA